MSQMEREEAPAIPDFEEFSRRIREKGIELPRVLLRSIHKLAKEKREFGEAEFAERTRSHKLRQLVARYSTLVKRGMTLKKEFNNYIDQARNLQPEGDSNIDKTRNLEPEGDDPREEHAPYRSLSPELGPIEDLVDALERARQDVIDWIHPSLAHPYKQKWESRLREYDLPRLGKKAPRAWFLLSAYELVFDYYVKIAVRAPKKETWKTLQGLMRTLFNEKVKLVTIEQLVRDHKKKNHE
jgi:hypothetical protein